MARRPTRLAAALLLLVCSSALPAQAQLDDAGAASREADDAVATANAAAALPSDLPTSGTTDPAVLAGLTPPSAAKPARPRPDASSTPQAAAPAEPASDDAAAAVATASTVARLTAISATMQPVLDAHNNYRARHESTPALTWSDTLAANAQAWADRCVFVHASGTGEGENLYATPATTNVPAKLLEAVTLWYDEISQYSYANPGFSLATGHFTQVVWRSSTQLGCGVRVCNGANGVGILVVCRYSPPGNYQGQFPQNVLPLITGPRPSPSPSVTVRPSPSPSVTVRPSPSPSVTVRPSPSPTPTPAAATLVPQGSYWASTATAAGCMYSPNRAYRFCMQADANLVLFKSTGAAIWASNTAGRSTRTPFRAVMQANGNFAVVDATNAVVWASNTQNRGVAPRRLALQNDGNVVILDARNTALWATNTAGR